MTPKTGPIQFPGERPGIYISNTDARILLSGRIGELKRLVRQCFPAGQPERPGATGFVAGVRRRDARRHTRCVCD